MTAEIDEETALGELYVHSLIRAQLRLALSVLGAVVLVIGSLPLLFLAVPALREVTVGPLPLPYVVLGVLVYPFALTVARAYVRAAERVERDYADLLSRT